MQGWCPGSEKAETKSLQRPGAKTAEVAPQEQYLSFSLSQKITVTLQLLKT